MAGFFQQFLKGAADGFLGSPYLKDYKHASKTFTTVAYQNSPKFKWLFHVYFEINRTLISDNADKALPVTSNYGLLVKTIDLPKFNIQLAELNQYNRKRWVQTKLNYDPIRITFHDDNANQIRHLWHTYYSYYYSDPSNPNGQNSTPSSRARVIEAETTLSKRNIYDNVIQENQRNWGYNGDTGGVSSDAWTTDKAKHPFFKSIQIYGFNQHNFAMYQLINPVIESFGHDTYTYSSTSDTMENTMSLRYETVKYYEGALNGSKPGEIVPGFADPSVYDTELSPINRKGTNKSIMGQGGLVDSATGILSDLNNGNILGAIQTAGRLSRTFKNGQSILQTAKAELTAGVISAVSNPQTVRSAFNFPALGSNTGTGGQNGNATNTAKTAPAPVSTPGNTTVAGNNIAGGP